MSQVLVASSPSLILEVHGWAPAEQNMFGIPALLETILFHRATRANRWNVPTNPVPALDLTTFLPPPPVGESPLPPDSGSSVRPSDPRVPNEM